MKFLLKTLIVLSLDLLGLQEKQSRINKNQHHLIKKIMLVLF